MTYAQIPQSQKWLLQGGLTLQFAPLQVAKLDIRIVDGVITEMAETLSPAPDEQLLSLEGKWVMPGLVCGHTHLYSALACGMPFLPEAPTSFADMLAKVWWRLDVALDEEAVEVSALVGGLSALRAGVTTLIDHHASPNAIENSLVSIDRALDTFGMRRILCYEVTDRGGKERALAGIKAHEHLLTEAASAHKEGMCATMLGAHANFTLSDQTLTRCAEVAKSANIGLHIHVAEAADDAKSTGENPVTRLERLGALLPGSILAHCVHTNADDLKRIQDAGAWVAHQSRSNMNNSVGYAPVEQFSERTMLGTDGIGADMFAELQSAWFRAQEGHISWSPQRWLEALHAGSIFAGQTLNRQLGVFAKGAVADLVVMDPAPGPPLASENLASAMIFRLSSGLVRHVMIHGSWQLWEREPVGISLASLDERASKTARDVWKRMNL